MKYATPELLKIRNHLEVISGQRDLAVLSHIHLHFTSVQSEIKPVEIPRRSLPELNIIIPE